MNHLETMYAHSEEEMLEREWYDAQWLEAAARNPAFEYLNDLAEDIYSLSDGKPFHDQE